MALDTGVLYLNMNENNSSLYSCRNGYLEVLWSESNRKPPEPLLCLTFFICNSTNDSTLREQRPRTP